MRATRLVASLQTRRTKVHGFLVGHPNHFRFCARSPQRSRAGIEAMATRTVVNSTIARPLPIGSIHNH